MDVTPIIVILWACTGGLVAVGLGLLGVAIRGWRPSIAHVPTACSASRPDHCHCCGYATVGLESEICPECGAASSASDIQRATRIRVACGVLGTSMLLAACLGPWADHVARHGLVHSSPAEALALVARYVPATRPVVARNLLGRADARVLSPSASRAAADLAAILLDSAPDACTRRNAAALLSATIVAAPHGAVDRLLSNRDSEVRAQGVLALSRVADAQSGPEAIAIKLAIATRLGRIALNDRVDRVRRTAIDELGEMSGAGPRLHVLLAALDDSSRSVRMRALLALSRERTLSPSAVFAVSRCLLDQEHDVRLAALLVMRRSRG